MIRLNEPVSVQELGHGVQMIDLMEGGRRARTGCYVIRGESAAIVEVGSSHAVPRVLAGLQALGLAPEQIEYAIVTHIHLDHSGGAGTLLPSLPNATVVCHPRAQRHLVDPSRLIAGARAVYGDRLEAEFGEVRPVPAERILVRQDGETLDLGRGHLLTFYDTPGHAKHHFSVHDPAAGGVFTGDTAGIRYPPEFTGWSETVAYVSSSPADFDLPTLRDSLARLAGLRPDRVYHGHFGVTEPAATAFARTLETAEAFDRIARAAYRPGIGWETIAAGLREYIRTDLRAHGLQAGTETLGALESDVEINAKGLLMALQREQARGGA